VTRGLYPNCTACRVSEKAPEMSACDATMAALVAITTMGYNPQLGTRLKKGLAAASGRTSSRADCPK
jgi:hypothetical protein